MTDLSVTGIIRNYHYFDRDFWLQYKALEAVCDPDKWDAIKMTLLKSKKVTDAVLQLVDLELFESKKKEIDELWKQKNEEAKLRGITVHEMIRNLLVTDIFNARKQYGISGEVLSSDIFLSALEGLFPELRLELLLDDEYKLIGIPDLIYIHDGLVDVIDWKTDDDIKFKSRFDLAKRHAKKLKYPLSKLDDVNGIHYLLQVSIYMHMILSLRPDLKPGKLKLVWVKDSSKTFEVEYLEKEVKQLIDWHLKATKLKVESLKCREVKY